MMKRLRTKAEATHLGEEKHNETIYLFGQFALDYRDGLALQKVQCMREELSSVCTRLLILTRLDLVQSKGKDLSSRQG